MARVALGWQRFICSKKKKKMLENWGWSIMVTFSGPESLSRMKTSNGSRQVHTFSSFKYLETSALRFALSDTLVFFKGFRAKNFYQRPKDPWSCLVALWSLLFCVSLHTHRMFRAVGCYNLNWLLEPKSDSINLLMNPINPREEPQPDCYRLLTTNCYISRVFSWYQTPVAETRDARLIRATLTPLSCDVPRTVIVCVCESVSVFVRFNMHVPHPPLMFYSAS